MIVQRKDLPAFTVLLVVACLAIAGAANAQSPALSPSPTPAPAEGGTGLYSFTSTIEIGLRGLDVNGDINKYRSDLNYKPGVRVFDSSFMVEDRTTGTKLFDKLLVNTSGFGADPQGAFRLNMETKGIYKLDANVRNVRYFNSLRKIAFNEHNADTQHNFGDFDLTIFPERENFRARLGYSFNQTWGDGGYTTRAYSDEFPVLSNIKSSSHDFRAGVEGKLLGFNLGFNYGHRFFSDDTTYRIDGLNQGNNATNTARLTSFQRSYPIEGMTDFGHFYFQRTFYKKLDLAGRFIYSESRTHFTLNETQSGRDNSNNIIDFDNFTSSGDTKRPQSRGDVGATYRVTDKFRISDTFTYDQFNIGGGNEFFEASVRRNPAGTAPVPFTPVNTLSNRITSYHRASNLIEGDYQVNNHLAFNLGYRYTHRDVTLADFDLNRINGAITQTAPEEFTNSTNSFIAGTRIKPLKNWTIYADVEKGNADNVFTRVANNDYTNFRIRTRASLKQFTFSGSFITKDNTNPSSSEVIPTPNFETRSKSRYYSANVDYAPRADLSFSTGYTYQHQTSVADILVPVNSVYLQGISQYFVRENYFFFDVSAQPIRRISLFASYRISDDRGQGSRASTRLQDIITGYPYKFQSPEIRLAIKLTRSIDWNVGYQYYDYNEDFPNAQNYSAHLPYTSLRFYFGKSAIER